MRQRNGAFVSTKNGYIITCATNDNIFCVKHIAKIKEIMYSKYIKNKGESEESSMAVHTHTHTHT